jgi:hypothetical protein
MLKGLSSILKKAVQVAAPIIGAATPLGPIFGAAAGSGLAGLLMGQKPEQALKQAAAAGLAGFTADKFGMLGKGSNIAEGNAVRTGTDAFRTTPKKFLENFKMPSLMKDGQLSGFGTALGVGLPSVLAYMGAAADAKRAQPMDPADYMSAVDRRYGGQFARPPEAERIQNLNPIIQQPQGRAEGGLMGTEFSYSAYDGSPMGIQTLADGGQTFPRKTGQISGPGGPKDDKIPAMLSDGEFVFTAKAVENAGGPKAMYKMMNRLDPESERPK